MLKKNPRKISRPNRRDMERYRRFAEAYLDITNPETFLKADRSAVQAGYSYNYAFHRGYELLGRVGVQKEIQRIRDSRIKSASIASPMEVLETLTTILRTLPSELVTSSGYMVPLNEMTRDQAQAIAGVNLKERVVTGGAEEKVIERRHEYKLVDRIKAAEMLARHHGLFGADNRQQVPKQLNLVAMPTGDLTLEEWQAQVVLIMAGDKQTQDCPAMPVSPTMPAP